MKVEDLIISGAEIKIIFHDCINLNDAYNKLKPFKNLGCIKFYSTEKYSWLKIKGKDIDITAFYR